MTAVRSRSTRTLALLVAASAVLFGTACLHQVVALHGSGDLETRAFEVDEVVSLDVRNSLRVHVTVDPGSEVSVAVTLDDDLFEYFLLTERDGILLLETTRSIRASSDAVIEVVTPSLDRVRSSGAASVTVAGTMAAPIVSFDASGASRVTVASVDTALLRVDVSGASRVTLDGGTAEDVDASVSGASTVSLADADVINARVDVSGASRIEVAATGRVSGSASGASSVTIAGEPQAVTVSTSGASNVNTHD